MSYASKDELRQAVRDWLTEDDTTVLPDSVIDDAIGFTEQQLNFGTFGPQQRTLRTFDMQRVQFSTITADDEEFISLPDDYLSMRYLYQRNTDYERALTYVTPEDFVEFNLDSGDALIYTVSKGQIRVRPALNQADEIEMGYFGMVPALTDSQPSNWVLEQNPSIYLNGTIANLSGFLQERLQSGQGAYFERQFERAVLNLITGDNRRVTGEGPLTWGSHEVVA